MSWAHAGASGTHGKTMPGLSDAISRNDSEHAEPSDVICRDNSECVGPILGHQGCPWKTMLGPFNAISGNNSECDGPALVRWGFLPKMMPGPSDTIGGNSSE